MRRRTLLGATVASAVAPRRPKRQREAVTRPLEYVNGSPVGPRLTPATIARPLIKEETEAMVKAKGLHPPGWKPTCACYWSEG